MQVAETPDENDSARVAQLKNRIANKKNELKILQSDIETPRLLESDIADRESKLAAYVVETVRTVREMRRQLATKKYRRDNLKEMYISASEELETLNQDLKRLQNAERIERLRALAAQLKEMGATPDDLKSA